MSEIPKIFTPTVNGDAVRRNPEHWPAQVSEFINCGYGCEKTRTEEERKRDPSGQEHAPPSYCFALARAWTDRMDGFIADYFVLPKGSFRDSHLDRSAKGKSKDAPQ